MAHLDETDRAAYLGALTAGAAVDHRGTPFTEDLLIELIAALTEPTADRPHLGRVRFDEAKFSGDAHFGEMKVDGRARFDGAQFEGDAWFQGVEIGSHAWFDRVHFGGDAWFHGVKFGGDVRFGGVVIEGEARFTAGEVSGDAQFGGVEISGDTNFGGTEIGGRAWFIQSRFDSDVWFDEVKLGSETRFDGAQFGSDAWFDRAKFGGDARYVGVKFGGHAWFDESQFSGDAWFDGAEFGGRAQFDGARFGGDASFGGAVFERATVLGPLVCAGILGLSEAVFRAAVTIEVAGAIVHCQRTRWASTAALRLRYATVDLSDAVVEYPVSISSHARPFTVNGEEMSGHGLVDPRVKVISLRGVDAAHLVLTDIDLTDCRFAGTIHLDQLRLEGRYTLAATPFGLRWRGIRPVRWTPRRTLAEEHHWRATRTTDADGWTPAPEREEVLEPAVLAPVYRQLRKSFEDSKHEPGAADFYYGEMEMRRHADDIPWAERALLTAYWALSGYGLRASRAVGWLLAAMTATVLAMMLWGLPQDSSKPISTGTLNGRNITMTTDTPDPVNPTGPWSERLSTERFEKSLRVVINSVVFRSSGQDLTTAGTYTEMASRFTEPVLLGLAILAVRGRVKR